MKNRYDQYSYDPPTPKNTTVDWLNGQMSSDVDGDGDPIGHDHDPNSPGRGGQIEASYIKNKPSNGLSSNNVQGAIDELKGLVDLGRIHVPMRQVVLQGKFDYNARRPVFISEVAGQLKLNLWASEVPLVCTICDGYDIYGQKDYVFAFTQDVPEAWTLPANKSFLQLYIEYNPTTKTATFGYTEVLSVWDYPSAPTIDMHWIDKDNLWIVQQWNGTAWEKKYRLMVGECTTDADSVTNVTCYALQGRSVVDSAPLTANQLQTLPHNIGRTPAKVAVSLLCIDDDVGYVVGDEIVEVPNYVIASDGTIYNRAYVVGVDRNNITTVTNAYSIAINNKTTGAALAELTYTKWKFRIRCEA